VLKIACALAAAVLIGCGDKKGAELPKVDEPPPKNLGSSGGETGSSKDKKGVQPVGKAD